MNNEINIKCNCGGEYVVEETTVLVCRNCGIKVLVEPVELMNESYEGEE